MANKAVVLTSPREEVVILDTRNFVVYPFTAPNWTDLRLGLYISLTQAAADDNTTALTETLTTTGVSKDRYFIGFKNNTDDLVDAVGSNCFGISNLRASGEGSVSSKVIAAPDPNWWVPAR